MLKTKPPKQKTCKICKSKFEPERQFQTTCDYQCAIEYSKQLQEKKEAKKKTEARVALREFKKNDKTVLKELAQKIFNQYIRKRDERLPCISCLKPYDGNFDCGHFKPRGGYSALAFNEDNCSGQCKKCNRFLSANLVNYRKNLIEKIGIERVEYLESCTNTKTWSVEELQEIITKYREKIKELSN